LAKLYSLKNSAAAACIWAFELFLNFNIINFSMSRQRKQRRKLNDDAELIAEITMELTNEFENLSELDLDDRMEMLEQIENNDLTMDAYILRVMDVLDPTNLAGKELVEVRRIKVVECNLETIQAIGF
jgi:hypothetical protein